MYLFFAFWSKMVDPHINKYAHLYEVMLNINLIQSLDILKFYYLTLSALGKINTNCFLHIFPCSALNIGLPALLKKQKMTNGSQLTIVVF